MNLFITKCDMQNTRNKMYRKNTYIYGNDELEMEYL